MAGSFFEGILNRVKKVVSGEEDSSELNHKLNQTELDSLKAIIHELDYLPDMVAKYLAAFAFILCRVAYADGQVSEEEVNEITSMLMKWGGLVEAHAVLVAKMASHQNKIFGGTDNFLVVREFKDMATSEQIHQLMQSLFAVAACDDSITSSESDTIRMITKELGISHQEFIAMRSQFRDKLEALK